MPKIDIIYIIRLVFWPYISFALKVVGVALFILLVFAVYAFIRLKISPFTKGYRKVINLKKMEISFKILDFIRWIYVDIITASARKDRFSPYGFTIYCGRQGAGKTISMVAYANYIHLRYPKCIIVSSFKYKYANKTMTSWHDLLTTKNGKNGVLFLIDEINGEYSSADWNDFPETLLSQISQQRKQCIKICASSQVYTRVVKQIREQTYTVVQCTTLAKRWTFNREYDATDYEIYCNDTGRKKKLKPIRKTSFIQDDFIRGCYDTWQVMERMRRLSEKKSGGFIERHKRGA